MSLILEALRKSEAERRAGQPVDPFAAPAPVIAAPPARRSNVAWIAAIVIVAVVLLIAVLAWAWRGRDVADDSATANAPQADATAPRESRSSPAAPAPAAGAEFPVIDRIAPPVAEAPAPASDPASPGPPTAAPSMAAAPLPPPATVPVPDPAPAPIAAPLPAPPPVPATRDSDTPQRLSELATTQRERLPALRISMHMWNADPARRFVIVDGHRQVEGDRLGAGVIRAIDPDGMLVDLDGQLVRVPRP